MIKEAKVKLTKEVLFEAIGAVSDEMLINSEQKMPKTEPITRRLFSLGAMAAALLIISGTLILAGFLSGPNGHSFLNPDAALSGGCYAPSTSTSTSTSTSGGCSPPVTIKKELKHLFEWDTNYNKVEEPASNDKLYIPGYFTKGLDQNEITNLLPDAILPEGNFTGKVAYSGSGDLIDVTICINLELYDNPIYVTISENDVRCSHLPEEEAVKSACGTVDYILYNYSADSYEYYVADAEINGLYYSFTVKSLWKENYEAKKYFKLTLERFATISNAPDLSIIKPGEIPYFENKELSYSEAKCDETYGRFIPSSPPSGFDESSFKRYIDSDENYLSAHWYNGLDYLDFRIVHESTYDIDYQNRLVTGSETEKYDLNLYPIPRAETVPEELTEVIDNPIFNVDELSYDLIMKRAYSVNDANDSNGLRMRFTVLYNLGEKGIYFIEINSKGVEPFWVFETLQNLR